MIDYINKSYNISNLNEEYEAFYYQDNIDEFYKLEGLII